MLVAIIPVFIMTGPHLVNGQPNQMNFNVTDSRNIQNIPVKKVQIEDIDIAYKKLGSVMLSTRETILFSSFSALPEDIIPDTLRKLILRQA